MNIKAYKTECCNRLHEHDNAFGIILKPGLFDDRESDFETVSPELASIHYCLECYNERVVTPVKSFVNQRKEPDKFANAIKEYSYMFKKSLFSKNIQKILEKKGK